MKRALIIILTGGVLIFATQFQVLARGGGGGGGGRGGGGGGRGGGGGGAGGAARSGGGFSPSAGASRLTGKAASARPSPGGSQKAATRPAGSAAGAKAGTRPAGGTPGKAAAAGQRPGQAEERRMPLPGNAQLPVRSITSSTFLAERPVQPAPQTRCAGAAQRLISSKAERQWPRWEQSAAAAGRRRHAGRCRSARNSGAESESESPRAN